MFGLNLVYNNTVHAAGLVLLHEDIGGHSADYTSMHLQLFTA